MLSEFEKDKHDEDYLITFVNTVKKKFTKRRYRKNSIFFAFSRYISNNLSIN